MAMLLNDRVSDIADICGAFKQQQTPEHDQHPSRRQLNPHTWHGHHEHDRQLHLPVPFKEVLRLLAVHVRRAHQVQTHQGKLFCRSYSKCYEVRCCVS